MEETPLKNGLMILGILEPELKSEIGLSESSQEIWETTLEWEEESVNLKLTTVQGIGCILGNWGQQ